MKYVLSSSGFNTFASSTGLCALLTGYALCYIHFFWSVTVFNYLNVHSASTNECWFGDAYAAFSGPNPAED